MTLWPVALPARLPSPRMSITRSPAATCYLNLSNGTTITIAVGATSGTSAAFAATR